MYLFFARAFDYPRPEFWDAVERKRPEEVFGDTRDLPLSSSGQALIVSPCSQEEREIEYVNTFVVGKNGTPPSPLYEGLYRTDEGREGLLMDLLRFYHYFELKLSERDRDFPDHLVAELEFMAYLADKEAAAIEEGKDSLPYRRAQRDFLDRHLLAWIPALQERIETRLPSSSYRLLIGLLAAFIDNQRKRLDLSLEGERA